MAMAWKQLVTSLVVFFATQLYTVYAIGDSYHEVDITMGRRATLPCTVSFSGSPQVMWLDPQATLLTRNENRVTDDERFSVHRPYPSEWNLMIEDVKLSDQGNYTCMIRANTVIIRNYVYLRIVSAPVIIHSSEDIEVQTGSDLTLECEASGTPEPTISWYKYRYNGDIVSMNTQGKLLIVYKATKDDAATYECQGDNGVPPIAKALIKVDITFAPITTLPHQDISQEEGKDTVLQCMVRANPHERIYWRKDGETLEESDKYRITTQDYEHYLKAMFIFIYDLHEEDFGIYECVAENPYGRANGSVELFEWQSGQIRIIDSPEDGIVQQYANMQINCTVEDMSHKDSVAWWRQHPILGYQRLFESHPSVSHENGEKRSPVYLQSDKYEIRGHYNLVIKNVTLEDAGIYLCEIVTKKNHSASVTVVDQLSCSNNIDNETYISEGETVSLSCSMEFSGVHQLWQTVWEHRDRKLSSIDNDDGALLRRIVSFPVFSDDSGEYVCVLSSRQPPFHSECSTEVTVISHETDPAPLCKAEPWDINLMTLIIIVASCVGGTTLIFIIIVISLCCHYKRKLRHQRPGPSSVRYHKNGSVNLETSHLTSPEAEEAVDV